MMPNSKAVDEPPKLSKLVKEFLTMDAAVLSKHLLYFSKQHPCDCSNPEKCLEFRTLSLQSGNFILGGIYHRTGDEGGYRYLIHYGEDFVFRYVSEMLEKGHGSKVKIDTPQVDVDVVFYANMRVIVCSSQSVSEAMIENNITRRLDITPQKARLSVAAKKEIENPVFQLSPVFQLLVSLGIRHLRMMKLDLETEKEKLVTNIQILKAAFDKPVRRFGLKNENARGACDNFCFANAVIQCFLRSRPFWAFLKTRIDSDSKSLSESYLFDVILRASSLTLSSGSREPEPVTIVPANDIIEAYKPEGGCFNVLVPGQSEDVLVFLRLVLDDLKDSIGNIVFACEGLKRTCEECKSESEFEEKTSDSTLIVRKNAFDASYSVRKAIESTLASSEKLEIDCPICGIYDASTNTRKRLFKVDRKAFYKTKPALLIVQIERADDIIAWGGGKPGKDKSVKHFKISDYLKVDLETTEYSLMAMISRNLVSIESLNSHFIAYVLESDEWIEYNDGAVTTQIKPPAAGAKRKGLPGPSGVECVDLSTVEPYIPAKALEGAYLLFYEKIVVLDSSG